MNTIASTRLSLPLGRNENQNIVSLDLAGSEHTLMVGYPASGKTVMKRSLMAAATRRGFDASYRDSDDARHALEALVALVYIRKDVLRCHKVDRWSDLPEFVLASENSKLRPMLFIIDDYGHRGFSKREIQSHRLQALLAEALSEVRNVGIHLVILTERGGLESMTPEMLAGFDNVIMPVSRFVTPSPELIAATFHGKGDLDKVLDAVESAHTAGTGNAVLVSGNGDITPFQFGMAGEE
ncbi:MAG TPA: hypothetical protein VF867_12815 [Arthrobacter sp.]